MNLIEGVVIRLLRDHHIFYASLLGQMRRIQVPDEGELRTCGVAVAEGRMYLYWNESFLKKLTDNERIAVLIHECLHLVYFHPFRRKHRTHRLFNWAADIAINQQITGLPKCALLPSTFGDLNLPLDQTMEVYYELLKAHQDKYKITDNGDGTFTLTRPDGSKVTIRPVDSHEDWNGQGQEEADIDGLDAEVIRQAVRESYNQPLTRGNLPVGIIQAIEDMLRPPVIPWTRQLKQYVGNKVKGDSKYTWKRLNKRFDTEDFKGKMRTRMLKLVAAIDTSGSIDVPEFQEFIAELKGIQQAYKCSFHIIECDAVVQRIYELNRHGQVDTNFKGRGGTRFEPVFEYIDEHNLRPDVLIYFTDLCGSFPVNKPVYSTLWVQVGDYRGIVPFGTVLRINDNKQHASRFTRRY